MVPWVLLWVPRVPTLVDFFQNSMGLLGLEVTPIPVSALENFWPLRGHSVPMWPCDGGSSDEELDKESENIVTKPSTILNA